MALNFDKEEMRRQFHELGRKRDAVLAQSKPHRDKIAELRPQLDALKGQIMTEANQAKFIEKPLYEIDEDRAQLARLLNGKTGKPEDYA